MSHFYEKEDYKKQDLKIDDHSYEVFFKRQVKENIDAPRLVVVSYLPNKNTIPLLKVLIKTIKKFTLTPYELWVVDNNSPYENIEWLDEVEEVNLALSRTNPKIKQGSYANAIGLEIGVRAIDQDSKYVMTLHHDTAVCKYGWLEYMLSRMDDKVRAVGVREDNVRVKDGILHVLGYLIDYQIFKELKLSFFPDLPNFDVGDKAIVELKKAGYKIFSTPNTIHDETLVGKISKNSSLRNLDVDRSFDDNDNVFFLHLGRGTLKSLDKYNDETKTNIDRWEEFLEKEILHEKEISEKVAKCKVRLFGDVWYTLRRYFVDTFFIESIDVFSKEDKILDIGGVKNNKRGMFNITDYDLDVKYLNITPESDPDYLADLTEIPVEDESFDGVILSEVLEHVAEPRKAIQEAFRILKKGGKVLICTPFLYHVHADPVDYARYTNYWYEEVLKEVGFKVIKIEHQGKFFSVLANMLKILAYEYRKKNRKSLKSRILRRLALWLTKNSFSWDKSKVVTDNVKLSNNTTGYKIICIKK